MIMETNGPPSSIGIEPLNTDADMPRGRTASVLFFIIAVA